MYIVNTNGEDRHYNTLERAELEFDKAVNEIVFNCTYGRVELIQASTNTLITAFNREKREQVW